MGRFFQNLFGRSSEPPANPAAGRPSEPTAMTGGERTEIVFLTPDTLNDLIARGGGPSGLDGPGQDPVALTVALVDAARAGRDRFLELFHQLSGDGEGMQLLACAAARAGWLMAADPGYRSPQDAGDPEAATAVAAVLTATDDVSEAIAVHDALSLPATARDKVAWHLAEQAVAAENLVGRAAWLESVCTVLRERATQMRMPGSPDALAMLLAVLYAGHVDAAHRRYEAMLANSPGRLATVHDLLISLALNTDVELQQLPDADSEKDTLLAGAARATALDAQLLLATRRRDQRSLKQAILAAHEIDPQARALATWRLATAVAERLPEIVSAATEPR
jgi:hypothetical protein